MKYSDCTIHETTQYETKNYNLFKHVDANRPVETNTPNRRGLKRSMEKHGWLKYLPMLCIPDPENFLSSLLIIDGQNRFHFAKELGVTIHFKVLPLTVEQSYQIIIDIQNGKPWQLSDHIHSYTVQGVSDYQTAVNWAKEHGLSVSKAFNLLAGELPSSNNRQKYVKDGTFKIRDKGYADRTMEIAHTFDRFNSVRGHSNLILACAKLARVPQFNLKHFTKKLDTNPSMVSNVVTCPNFLQMIEEIYNRKVKTTSKTYLIPLVEQAMAERNPVIKTGEQK